MERRHRPITSLPPARAALRRRALGVFLVAALMAGMGSALAIGAPVPVESGIDAVDAVDAGETTETVGSPARAPASNRRPAGGPTLPQASGTELVGTFHLDPGECEAGQPTGGSWFRMQTRNGSFFPNNDSPCGDNTYTPLSPGSDGGFLTSDYQPHPDPAFAGSGGRGDALADRIMTPQAFFGTDFSAATQQVDPQTDTEVPVPLVTDDGGELTGDLRAWNAAWNGEYFNQGAPKPDGTTPGDTTTPTGTIDHATGRYTLEWRSLIVGGPFDGNVGIWHLEGTFQASSEPGSPPTGGTAAASTAPVDGDSATDGPAASVAPEAIEPGSNGDLPRTGGAAPLLALVLWGTGLAARHAHHRLR